MNRMTMFVRRVARLAVVGMTLVLALTGTARAQTDPNTGALTFTGGLDLLPGSAYVFRGIVQESDPELTLWPYGDLGITLASSEGSVKSVGVNLGVWNSLHTGSSGSDGPGKIHYEEDFYSTLTLGFGGGVAVATTYTAYTSPNDFFDTVNEVSFKVSMAHRVAPYAILAFEMGDGSADGGSNSGTYLEFGVGPAFPLGSTSATLTVPVKIGLSLSDYYEHPETGEDEPFGFFDIGGMVTLPLSGIPPRFGSWNVHGGIDFLFLGNTTEAFNGGDNAKVTGLLGVGVSY